ncbi:MAG TPA: TetR/AcrR family transcriptional regulator [Rhodocyclaceae bacterium]|nr:TetR/AcrR family transcriptional regulator [Rhodocyclaceae bacterium]
MPHVPADRPPQQERSRRTHSRLLEATLKTLAEHGLDGATIPRIARVAGVSPATVYRRFVDKQGLLRAACLHMLERSNQANREHLVEKLGQGPLERAARMLIGLMFMQHHQQPKLIQAMENFVGSDDDQAFVRAASAIVDDNLDLLIQAMLTHRAEITHSDPELAVRIATVTAATAIGTRALKPRSIWRTLQPITDDALADELARAYVAYLRSGT